jgi:hypothetical protein
VLGLPELTNDMSVSDSEKSAWVAFAFKPLLPLAKGDLTDSSSELRGVNAALFAAFIYIVIYIIYIYIHN